MCAPIENRAAQIHESAENKQLENDVTYLAKSTKAATHLTGVLALLVASAGLAVAAGGGGGGGGGTMAVPSIAGTWNGIIVNPAPVVSSQATLTVQQDAAGNLSAELCSSVTGQPSCGPMTGQMRTNGQFELRGENFLMTGMISGTVACADGSLGEMISGATQAHGSTGSFGFNNCP